MTDRDLIHALATTRREAAEQRRWNEYANPGSTIRKALALVALSELTSTRENVAA